jgi:hypothetical protein
MAFFTDKQAVKFIDDELEQSMDEIGCPVDFTLASRLVTTSSKFSLFSGNVFMNRFIWFQ